MIFKQRSHGGTKLSNEIEPHGSGRNEKSRLKKNLHKWGYVPRNFPGAMKGH
jgi:hypothetical protein